MKRIFYVFMVLFLWLGTGANSLYGQNALNFDGTNDFVSVPDASSLDLTSTFTFESWVYPTAYATTAAPTYGAQGFIGKNRSSGGGTGYFFGMISGNLTVLLNNNVTNVGATSTTLVPLNTWSHVAATYDGTTIRMYLNGTQVFTQALSSFTLLNSSEPLYIGGTGTSGTSTWLFAGNMDEARIWNTARSASQIANNYNCQLAGSESSLAAYYKFNQGIAAGTNTGLTTLTDATANANNGTLSNFALTGATSNWVTSGVSTTVTPSVSIAASTSGTISSTTSVTFTATPTNGGGSPTYQWKKNGTDVGTNSTTYTNATWANNDIVTCVLTSTVACVTSTTATSTGITMTVTPPKNGLNFDGVNDQVDCGNAASVKLATGTIEAWIKTSGAGVSYRGIVVKQLAYGLFLNSNVLVAYDWTTSSEKSTGVNLADGQWHHVALSFQPTANQSKIYIDGVPRLTITSAWGVNAQTNPLLVGEGDVTGGQSFNGSIDEVRVWNTARTDAQIISDYTCLLTGSESGLVAHYNFNQGVAASTNTGLTTLTDATTNANNGTLKNFALTGATSNWVAADIITEVTPSVSIAASPSGAINAGTNVTFTATAGAHKGAAPTYQWKKNGTNISGANSATYATSTLANGDIISCTLTNTGTCLSTTAVTSTGITMSVNAVLPVELLDFKGTPLVKGNLLTWTTANEANNKGFQVERLMDNGQWASLGFVKAQGKAATYEYLDNQPLTTSYYRLRQIDNDGKETLSKVISVERKGNNKLKAYPNPVSNILTVETTEQGDVQILNLLGQQVFTGKATQQIDVSALPEGTYVLKVGTEQVKFVKQ